MQGKPSNCEENHKQHSTCSGRLQKYADNLNKMETFDNLKYKIYQYTRLNTLKGIFRNRDLLLSTLKEVKSAFGKQGVTDYKRVTIRRVLKKYKHTFWHLENP